MDNLHKHAITHHHLHRGNLKPELSLLSSSFYFPFLFSFGSLFDQWVWELKNEIFYLDLVVKVWKEGILVWICVWFRNGFEFVIWFWVCGLGIGGCGSGCGRWWLVAVDWVLQWVSVCFTVGFGGFQCVLQWVSMGSRSGLVSDGGGGLGILLMAVAGGGREGWLGCFCLGEKIHRERERKRCEE